MASICQIGLVEFVGGAEISAFSSLINPLDYFDDMNMAIHGIGPDMVDDAPTFRQVWAEVRGFFDGRIVVSHTPFDRTALSQALNTHGGEPPDCRWLDSSRVARRTWPAFCHSGFGLAPLADHLGIEFHHHDATEDARTAGRILLNAIAESGVGVEEWLSRSHTPLSPRASSVDQPCDPAGVLFGEMIVFTGSLKMYRVDAARMAAGLGCSIGDSITKKTSILVVGDQDICRLADGETKSSKHRRAEELIRTGAPIRILRETDFMALCGMR